MSKLFAVAAMAVALAGSVWLSATSAEAGTRKYVLCWTNSGGYSQCVHLPRNYRLPGISKPRIAAGTTDFVLTRRLINCILRNYVSTADMHPGQEATIYAPKA